MPTSTRQSLFDEAAAEHEAALREAARARRLLTDAAALRAAIEGHPAPALLLDTVARESRTPSVLAVVAHHADHLGLATRHALSLRLAALGLPPLRPIP